MKTTGLGFFFGFPVRRGKAWETPQFFGRFFFLPSLISQQLGAAEAEGGTAGGLADAELLRGLQSALERDQVAQ